MTSARRSDGLAPWAVGLALVGLIVVLGRISDVGSIAGLPIKPWRPSVGLIFGILLTGGVRFLPWVLLGSMLSIVVSVAVSGAEVDWSAPVLSAAWTVTSYCFAAELVRRVAGEVTLQTVGDALRVLLVGGATTTVAAAGEVVVFTFLGPLPEEQMLYAYGRLCVGHFAGIAVITPIVLRLRERPFERLRRAGSFAPAELATGAVLLVTLSWVIFGFESTNEFKLFDLLFLPITVLAVRQGVDGALVGLVLAQLSMTGWLRWLGFPPQVVFELQFLMLILSTTSLFVGLLVEERQKATAELRLREQRLREQDAQIARSARLNSVGQMAAVLAHELNQPLAAIRAHLRAAARRLAAHDAEVAGVADELERGVAQVDLAAAVIRRVRQFVRRGEPRRSQIDPGILLREAIVLGESAARARGVDVDLDVAAALPRVMVDEFQIKQVVLNLMLNAIEAMAPDAQTREIRASVRTLSDGAVEFAIRDSGSGMPEARRAQLFTSFVSSKAEGLGLGLAIARTIVEAHGGRLWLEATGPRGSEFRFVLPVQAAP